MSEPPPKPATKTTSRARKIEPEESSPPRWVLPAIMISILVVGGWFIIQNLAETGKMEGRHNCVPPIDTSNMGH